MGGKCIPHGEGTRFKLFLSGIRKYRPIDRYKRRKRTLISRFLKSVEMKKVNWIKMSEAALQGQASLKVNCQA
jgi:hypothetical protein